MIEKTLTGTVAGIHAFGYDPAGNMTTMQKSGGTPNVVNVTTRAHNPLNQVTGLSGGGATLVRGVLNEPGSASIGKAGQPLTPARMTAGNTFEEELNLSTGQNTIAVRAEDATGNVSNYTFRTDIAPVTARAFTYDADGNMTSDGILTYEWDCLNRLTRINRGGTKATRFYYNALGQRVVIGEVDGTTFTDLKFLAWDGIQLLSLRKGPASSGYSGAKYERRYYPQGEQTILQDAATGNLSVTATHHYTRDHLGSVREVVKTDGTLQARYDYDPYGKRIAQYESTAYGTCPFGFTGHYTQKSPIAGQGELVLTHFRAYEPELGRWISADPIGEIGGINLYGYVGGDPINEWDLLGLVGEITLGSGYTGRIDKFNGATGADFETHVFDPKGREVGVCNVKGWINKHGAKNQVPVLPKEVLNRLNGLNIEVARGIGAIPPKGFANIKGLRGNLRGVGGGAMGWMGAVEANLPAILKRTRNGQPMIPLFDYISGAKALRVKKDHENGKASMLNATCPRS